MPFIVVATKVDRVKRSKRASHFKAIGKGLRINPSQIIPFSSTDKEGQDDVWGVMLDVVADFQV